MHAITRHISGLLLMAAFLLVIATPARAYLRIAPSDTLEWIVADSDLIIRGTLEKTEPVPIGKDNITRITLRVGEVFKHPRDAAQPIAAGSRITFTNGYTDPTINVIGAEYIICLIKTERHVKNQQPILAELAAGYRAHPYTVRHDWVNRNGVRIAGASSAEWPTLDGRRINTSQFQDALRAECARPQRAHGGMLEIILTPSSQAYPSGNGFRPYLNILVDDRAEARAREWIKSTDPTDRWNGVSVLARLQSAENAELLRQMLNDPHATLDGFWPGGSDFMYQPGQGKWMVNTYPIRKVAYDALKEWGWSPVDAVVELQIHGPVPLPRWTPRAIAIALGSLLALIILRRWLPRRSRSRSAGPSSKRRPILAGLSGASLILLIAAVALWINSHYRVTELAFPTTDSTRIEISALAGKLRVGRFTLPEPASPVAFTTVRRDPAGKIDSDWRLPPPPGTWGRVSPLTSHAGRLGFDVDRGELYGPNFTSTKYAALSIPFWAICILFSIPPALRLVLYLRRRNRNTEGLCLACGYDLRATPDRCPECGATPAAAQAI